MSYETVLGIGLLIGLICPFIAAIIESFFHPKHTGKFAIIQIIIAIISVSSCILVLTTIKN